MRATARYTWARPISDPSEVRARTLWLFFDVNVAGCSIGEPGSYYGRDGYGLYRGSRSRAVPGLEEFFEDDIFLTDALTLRAEEEMSRAIEEGVPFYLNMAHYAVHWPFMPDPRFVSHYQDTAFSRDAVGFATLIEGMDRSLGEIMDFLVEKGVAENTLIFFLGDNGSDAPIGEERGYGSSAPLRGKKGTEFEGGIRVPFIVAWAAPEGDRSIRRGRSVRNTSGAQRLLPIPQGEIRTQIGTIMDIYPTIAVIVRGEDSRHPGTFLMHFPHDHRGKYFTTYREDDWKLIYYWSPEKPSAAHYVLYDLASDPYEAEDVSARCPDVTASMLEHMTAQLEQEGARCPVDSAGRPLSVLLPQRQLP